MILRRILLSFVILHSSFVISTAATGDYVWSQIPANGPLVARRLTPTVGRLIGFPSSIDAPATIILGSGLTLTGSTLSVSASGGTWGSITGTLSAQTDLATALGLKANTADLGALALLSAVASANITDGTIVNADINASAAIALSKLAATTASRLLVSDASGFVSPSSVTSTEAGYLSGVTSAVQTQITARMLRSVYDPAAAGYITGTPSGLGAVGGTLDMDAGPDSGMLSGGNGGTVVTVGGAATLTLPGGNGGTIDTSGVGEFAGGNLTLTSNGSNDAGSLNTQAGGSITTGTGNINTGNTTGTLGSAAFKSASDTAYDATSWNANTDVPTKNAVRDKFESLSLGKVLQMVVVTPKTDTASGTNQPTSWSTVYSGSITPTSATSSIVVMITGNYTGTANYAVFARVARGSTALAVGDAASNRSRVQLNGYGSAGSGTNGLSIIVADSPATTSSTTYNLQLAVESGGTWYLNRTASDTDQAYVGRGATTMILMEVAP